MGWYRMVERFLNRSPACPGCGGPTIAVNEDLVHDLPPVLEARYECPRCDEEVITRDVVDFWG